MKPENAAVGISAAESDPRSGLAGHWSFDSADKSNATSRQIRNGKQWDSN